MLGSSPARPSTPPTSTSPARCTWSSCAALTRTTRIKGIDLSGALAAPGVVGAYTGAEICASRWATPMPCAWAVPRTCAIPSTVPVAVEAITAWATRWQWSSRSPTSRPETRSRRSWPTTTRSLRSSTSRPRCRTKCWCIRKRHNTSYTWELVIGAEAVDAAFAAAADTVKERYIQQRLIPMARRQRCARRRLDLKPFGRRASAPRRSWHLDDGRGSCSGCPSTSCACGAGGGRRLRLQARRLTPGSLLRRGGLHRGCCSVGRGAHRERGGDHPGPRPDPGHRAGRRRRRRSPHRGAGRRFRDMVLISSSTPSASRSSVIMLVLRRAGGPACSGAGRVHDDDASHAYQVYARRRPTPS